MGKILAFGEVMMRLSVPDYKKLSQSNILEYSFSGTGMNVLSGLSQFGHEVELLTKLPKNSLGEAAKSQIRKLGISDKKVIYGDEYIGMYFLEQGYGNRNSKVTYTNRLESSFCKSKLDEYNLEEILKDVKLIHFCGISLAVTENVREIIFEIVKKAKQKNILISFDCNYRSSLWENYEEARPIYKKMLELSDIVFASEQDAIKIFELTSEFQEEEKRREDFLYQIKNIFSLKAVACTKREILSNNHHRLTGIYLNDKIYYSPNMDCFILDRIGGGDGFTAGILHGILKEYSFQDTVEFAMASGILAHTTSGDSPISSIEDVRKIIKDGVSDVSR